MNSRLPPPVLSTDAMVKRVTLAALVGLIFAQFASALFSALLAVLVLYLLLVVRNTAG
jgi:glycerol uptake facilitator-like aquaporin